MFAAPIVIGVVIGGAPSTSDSDCDEPVPVLVKVRT
jgi:hypothetical protein